MQNPPKKTKLLYTHIRQTNIDLLVSSSLMTQQGMFALTTGPTRKTVRFGGKKKIIRTYFTYLLATSTVYCIVISNIYYVYFLCMISIFTFLCEI